MAKKTNSMIEMITLFDARIFVPKSTLIQRVSAYGVCIDQDCSEVLLLTNAESGKLCIPGGEVELGETNHQALRRELKEETGVKKLHIGPHLFFTENFFYYNPPNKPPTPFHAFLHFYMCDVKKGDVKGGLDSLQRDPKWYKISDLQETDFNLLAFSSFWSVIRRGWNH